MNGSKPSYGMRYVGIALLALGGGAAMIGGWGWLWAVLAWIAGAGFLKAQKSRFRQLADRVAPHRPEIRPGGFCFRVQVDGEEDVDVHDMGGATGLVKILEENGAPPWIRPGERAWASRQIALFRILMWEHGVSIPVQKFSWDWKASQWVEEWSVEAGGEAVMGATLQANARLRQQQAAAAAASQTSFNNARSSSWP